MRGTVCQSQTLLAGAVWLVLLCCPALAQPSSLPATLATVPPPAFEMADVHISPHSNTPRIRGGGLRGDRYVLRDATMANLVAYAYGVETANVLSGPSWLDLDRFDIIAKAPKATPPDNIKPMLHALLADRFKLVAHTDSKPLPAYVLSMGKGAPKMKQAESSDEPGGCQFQQPAKDTVPTANMAITFSCHNTTMKAFADFLHGIASPYLKRPVAIRPD